MTSSIRHRILPSNTVGIARIALLLAAFLPSAKPVGEQPSYCRIGTPGARVKMVRPGPGDAAIDDVNWFARPVPNREGNWIIAFASHDQNYLYDLTNGNRIRIPDKSDAVATPDGAFITVPSHYTDTHTINFYAAAPLLKNLASGENSQDAMPAFAHHDPDMVDAYYQSVGLLSKTNDHGTETSVYRMMFSGSRHPQPPGFRIVEYTVKRTDKETHFAASAPMKLCPEIVKDMATPFISKDGRYVIAHDDGVTGKAPSLKIFEIQSVDYNNRTCSCRQAVDFGFSAGKADFSFDGSKVTFHISKFNPLIVFVNGGIPSPAITDVVVADLKRDSAGKVISSDKIGRVTTSEREGVGKYFPAFFPDGNLLYISSDQPQQQKEDRKFHFTVVDPRAETRTSNFFADPDHRGVAEKIGQLWYDQCGSSLKPFKEGEAAWWFLSLSTEQCKEVVGHGAGLSPTDRKALRNACAHRF